MAEGGVNVRYFFYIGVNPSAKDGRHFHILRTQEMQVNPPNPAELANGILQPIGPMLTQEEVADLCCQLYQVAHLQTASIMGAGQACPQCGGLSWHGSELVTDKGDTETVFVCNICNYRWVQQGEV